ncbi:MAG: hypothetical protein SFV54_16370 [Bryobacteraceae bacterium]|nr:hypothetical protein [Bryobacteraceae bacterium]
MEAACVCLPEPLGCFPLYDGPPSSVSTPAPDPHDTLQSLLEEDWD